MTKETERILGTIVQLYNAIVDSSHGGNNAGDMWVKEDAVNDLGAYLKKVWE